MLVTYALVWYRTWIGYRYASTTPVIKIIAIPRLRTENDSVALDTLGVQEPINAPSAIAPTINAIHFSCGSGCGPFIGFASIWSCTSPCTYRQVRESVTK